VVGLHVVTVKVDGVGGEVGVGQGRDGDGQQRVFLQAGLGAHEAFGLFQVPGVLGVAFDFGVGERAPAQGVVGVGAAHVLFEAQHGLAFHARGDFPLTEGHGLHGPEVIHVFDEIIQLGLVEEVLDRDGVMVEPQLVHEGLLHFLVGQFCHVFSPWL